MWTMCTSGGNIARGSHVGLMQDDNGELVEVPSFGLAKQLRTQAKYWLIHALSYADLEIEYNVVRILSIDAPVRVYGVTHAPQEVKEMPEDPLGFEAAFLGQFANLPNSSEAPVVEDDPLGIDAAFECAFPSGAGAEGSDASSLVSEMPSESEGSLHGGDVFNTDDENEITDEGEGEADA